MAQGKRRGGPPATKNDVALARARERTHARLIDRGSGVARTFLRWTGTIWVAIEAKGAVETIAAGTISIDGVLRYIISGAAERWIVGGVAAICALFAYRERRLRRKVTKSQGDRIRALEQELDPGRSSSRLLSDGRASKGDDDDT